MSLHWGAAASLEWGLSRQFAPVAPVAIPSAPAHRGHSFFNADKHLQNSAPVAPVAPVKSGMRGKKTCIEFGR